jgi:xanthosine phosphorylase
MNQKPAPAHLAYEAIKPHMPEGFSPKLGLVLGSGLGVLAHELEQAVSLSYDDIPGFFSCSVAGHGGHLYMGYLRGIPVVCLQGRPHFYEGISNEEAQTPMRTLKLLGCDTVLSTNASGSLHEHTQPGSLVIIKDHINFQFRNPLVGPNDERFGDRFIGMEDTYNPELRTALKASAERIGIEIKEGVYFGVLGPSFETPAEINAFRLLGGDVVGMSTIPEVISARHAGLRVAVVAVITNLAAGMHEVNLSHEETLRGAKLATDKLIALVHDFLDHYEVVAA